MYLFSPLYFVEGRIAVLLPANAARRPLAAPQQRDGVIGALPVHTTCNRNSDDIKEAVSQDFLAYVFH